MIGFRHNNPLLLLCALLSSINSLVLVAANDIDYDSLYLSNKQLLKRVEEWSKNPDAAARSYGAIKNWDLQNVTSLRNLFSFKERFNEDISSWNVSSVTDFSSLFWEASGFDGDLGAWDVSRAETMACMFCGASSYTGKGLDEWHDKLGNVQDMFNMFEGSAIGGSSGDGKSSADLSSWQVASVTNFRQMFMDTPNYNQKLCWNVSVLARVGDMFNKSGASFNADCVVDHILEDAGLSSAVTTQSLSSLMIVGLASLMAAGSLF